MTDAYLTVGKPARGEYSEKGSKFLAFAFHMEDEGQIRQTVAAHRKQYYDARHVCYAFVLGPGRASHRASDDGAPPGTAGKPILGQLNSRGLTDTLVIVVRYFGGTKLGVPGLINAYREATADALDHAEIEERTVDVTFQLSFAYELLNQVMRAIKDEPEARVTGQDFQLQCQMTVAIRLGAASRLEERLGKIARLNITAIEDL